MPSLLYSPEWFDAESCLKARLMLRDRRVVSNRYEDRSHRGCRCLNTKPDRRGARRGQRRERKRRERFNRGYTGPETLKEHLRQPQRCFANTTPERRQSASNVSFDSDLMLANNGLTLSNIDQTPPNPGPSIQGESTAKISPSKPDHMDETMKDGNGRLRTRKYLTWFRREE